MHSYVKMCVATGGGIVSENKNWGKMQTGMVVWLDMEVRLEEKGNVRAHVRLLCFKDIRSASTPRVGLKTTCIRRRENVINVEAYENREP